jgi:transposase
LLKNRENLKKDEPQRLERLLRINRNLQAAYILKEQLETLWNNPTISEMEKALTQWCSLAKESGIKALEKFAKTLETHRTGILNYCVYPINTAKLEATNNTIGLIRRKAYGFHDKDYFILKIF